MQQQDQKEFDFCDLIGYNTIIYGESGSGKSTIILDILFRLKDRIPSCIIISPTESQTNTYKDIVPDYAIISTDLERERLKLKLSQILKRQQKVTQEYKTANDELILQSIVEYAKKYVINDDLQSNSQKNDDNQIIKQIDNIQNQIQICADQQKQAENDQILQQDPAQLNHILQQFDDKIQQCKQKLLQQYKQIIQIYKDQILNVKSDIPLSSIQIIAIQNLHIDPKLLVILDDCGSIFDLQMQKDPILKSIFFAGRHSNITVMIAVQSDKTICPDLRSQAFFSFFCSYRILESFGKNNNGIDPKTAKFYSERLKQNRSEHEKLLFVRRDCSYFPFVPQKHQKFQFGSSQFQKYCEFIKKQST